jgi:3-oxoacyl-[acyl-carrier-protein] synthase II
MVLGEGAGSVVLEEYEVAKARNAHIYGEVVARGSSTAASPNSIADRRTALRNAISSTLKDAGLNPGDVGHVHAHGISTRSGDREEAAAIAELFGDLDQQRPVTAAKSYFGNLGAGSGMVELIASLLALEHGKLFPILNYEHADPECPVAAVCRDDTSPGGSFVNLSVTPQAQAASILVRAVA